MIQHDDSCMIMCYSEPKFYWSSFQELVPSLPFLPEPMGSNGPGSWRVGEFELATKRFFGQGIHQRSRIQGTVGRVIDANGLRCWMLTDGGWLFTVLVLLDVDHHDNTWQWWSQFTVWAGSTKVSANCVFLVTHLNWLFIFHRTPNSAKNWCILTCEQQRCWIYLRWHDVRTLRRGGCLCW